MKMLLSFSLLIVTQVCLAQNPALPGVSSAADIQRQLNRQAGLSVPPTRTECYIVDGKLVEKTRIKLTKIGAWLRETGVRSQVTEQTGCVLERDIYESYVVEHRHNALGQGWDVYDQRKVGSEKLFVKASFPTNNIGDFVQIEAFEVNPVEGLRSFELPREPTVDEWKKVQSTSAP